MLYPFEFDCGRSASQGETLQRQTRVGRAALLAFREAEGGATAVEFAFVAPAVLLTLLFLLSVGYMLFMAQTLDFATQKSARQLRTGAVQAASLTQTQFRTKTICPLLPTMFNCDNVIVNLQAVPYGTNHPYEYYAFVNSDQSGLIVPTLSNASTSYCPGQAGGYVYLQVLYPVNFFLSLLSSSAIATTYGGKKVYLIMSTATVLNEPFTAPASSC